MSLARFMIVETMAIGKGRLRLLAYYLEFINEQ